MANMQINITENGTKTLATAGKYCDRNIDINVNVMSLDSSVEEFPQMNDKVTQYLTAADAAYTDSNGDTVSVMENYQTATGDKDRPLGYPLTATSGNLYLQNEENGNGWMLSVGTDTVRNSVFNAIPGSISQYLVKDANGNLLENGRIKPTGKVRMIRFLGYIRNCRDLGGWACDGGTVNYGKLFRSAVVESTETWIDPKISENIGIRHHIDFRDDDEASHITESCLGANVRYDRIPLNLYYKDIIDTASADYENAKKVFRTIIDSVIHDEPVIFNCSLGRDRTGTVAFLILALLGVARADIDKDYELSSFSALNAPCARTRGDYREVATYLATMGGSNLRDNAVWWFIKAGFSLEELNAFRSAMTDGTPDELNADDYILPTYTNQIPKSIDTDGNPYNGGKGWKTGYRLNSSGVETEATGFEVTGFIEATAGDVIRFKNLTSTDASSNTRMFFYTSAFVKNNTPLSAQSLIDLFNAGQYTVDSLYADCKYFRISANSISDDSIVTINEPID